MTVEEEFNGFIIVCFIILDKEELNELSNPSVIHNKEEVEEAELSEV
jgi:hypothetical protein